MGNKHDIFVGLAAVFQDMIGKPAKTKEEIDSLGERMPVVWMMDPALTVRYVVENGMNLQDAIGFIRWAYSIQALLDKIDVVDDKVTVADLNKALDSVTANFVVVHRVNYMLHETMLAVYDLLERDKRMRHLVKKYRNAAESVWSCSVSLRRQRVESTAWYTMQDHLCLAYGVVESKLEKVYEVLRDYMIHLGWRDVELKARCCVALLMGKVACASYGEFFSTFRNDTGINFSRLYVNDDMKPMVRSFASMCDALGIKTHIDQYGLYEIEGFDPDKNQRFKTAWASLMKDLRDEDLMDESAMHALELNVKAQEKYKYALDEIDAALEEKKRQEMEEGFKLLEQKYKVTKI